MLGFHPLAAAPLAALLGSGLVAVPESLSGTATIVFGGEGSLGAHTSLSARGTVTFGG
jgi:hypothetical protein